MFGIDNTFGDYKLFIKAEFDIGYLFLIPVFKDLIVCPMKQELQ